ncbi:hypothetical protein K2Z84_10390 [Candidatus Binatia bacterium]|nr:hypothetical protein [Candidatus Binatia bacterium]
MRALSAFRRRTATGRFVAVSGVVYLVSQLAIGHILDPLGPLDVLRAQTTLDPSVVAAIFARWREQHLMDAYVRHYFLDFVHPALYAAFLGASLSLLLDRNRLSPSWNVILLLPIVAALCDLLENVSHVAFLVDRANLTPARVAVSGIAAIAKWLLAAGSLAAIALLALRARTTGKVRA